MTLIGDLEGGTEAWHSFQRLVQKWSCLNAGEGRRMLYPDLLEEPSDSY